MAPSPATYIRRFHLDRTFDHSGVSGVGVVAEGVTFSDGTTVLHWLGALSSLAIYASVADAVAIHGHEGSTDLVWLDEDGWRRLERHSRMTDAEREPTAGEPIITGNLTVPTDPSLTPPFAVTAR